jgi:hypothetical protein
MDIGKPIRKIDVVPEPRREPVKEPVKEPAKKEPVPV